MASSATLNAGERLRRGLLLMLSPPSGLALWDRRKTEFALIAVFEKSALFLPAIILRDVG